MTSFQVRSAALISFAVLSLGLSACGDAPPPAVPATDTTAVVATAAPAMTTAAPMTTGTAAAVPVAKDLVDTAVAAGTFKTLVELAGAADLAGMLKGAGPYTILAPTDAAFAKVPADIVAALKTVNDPEIPADIYELGLIYKIDIADDRMVTVDMTLTAPGCPVAGEMPGWVDNAVSAVPGVQGCTVNLTFDPPWNQSRMSEEAKLAVGMF